jgi:uncharacterized phiE125 gp8 family phage protein
MTPTSGHGYMGGGGGYLGPLTYGYLNYPTRRLTVTSPPQSWEEPVSLAQAKKFIKLPPRPIPDPAEDLELGMYISSARYQAEVMQGRDLVQKQWDLALDYWPQNQMIILAAPLVSVDLVQRTDWTGTVTVMNQGPQGDYVVDKFREPGFITPPYNHLFPAFVPQPSSAVLVRFTSGLTPDDAWWQLQGQNVMNGMLMLIHQWFTKKLPFVQGAPVQEIPFGLTCALRQGALISVR